MIRKRYELVVNESPVLRLRQKQNRVVLERKNPYGGWTDPTDLNREAILELRDCLDSILSDWFCPPEEHRICPVCEDMLTSKKSEPLVFAPADVGRLDMGESLAGRETGQEMQGGCEGSSVEADEDYLERLRRTT